MGFFKKLFKDDTEKLTSEEEIRILNDLSGQIKAEESILDGTNSKDTNKLSEVPTEIATEALKGFSCYQFIACSNPGNVRESNQDSIFTGEYKFYVSNKVITAGMGIVADGMGGLSSGEDASSTAIGSVSTFMCARLSEYMQDSLSKGTQSSQTILEHIKNAIQNANRIVIDKGKELGEEIGTTLTCVFLLGGAAYFGHVGDSRAYLIDREQKSIERVSKDHSLVGRLIEMGKLTEKEAKKHPRRNEIYRMLGLRSELEVDTYSRIIDKNSIIVLMSDGLWEFVDDSELLNIILNSADPSKSADILIDLANKNGGLDNISVCIIKPVE